MGSPPVAHRFFWSLAKNKGFMESFDDLPQSTNSKQQVYTLDPTLDLNRCIKHQCFWRKGDPNDPWNTSADNCNPQSFNIICHSRVCTQTDMQEDYPLWTIGSLRHVGWHDPSITQNFCSFSFLHRNSHFTVHCAVWPEQTGGCDKSLNSHWTSIVWSKPLHPKKFKRIHYEGTLKKNVVCFDLLPRSLICCRILTDSIEKKNRTNFCTTRIVTWQHRCTSEDSSTCYFATYRQFKGRMASEYPSWSIWSVFFSQGVPKFDKPLLRTPVLLQLGQDSKHPRNSFEDISEPPNREHHVSQSSLQATDMQ